MMKIKRLYSFLYVICLGAWVSLGFSSFAHAACGTTIMWQADAGTTAWANTNNWNPRNIPDNANETAFIRADWQVPALPNGNRSLSCLEINSGTMNAPAGNILTISGDYFRNLNTGSLIVPGGSSWTVSMSGTDEQTYDNIDPIPRLTINNPTTVTITQPTVITNLFTINGGSGHIVIAANMETQQTSTVTIPTSAIVTVNSGIELKMNGGLTVNGVLKLMPGASLKLANGRTLSVGNTGSLILAGAPGNSAIIDSYGTGATYTFNVAGQVDAEYFSIGRMTAAGMNVTGDILDLSNGSFNYIPNNGYGITLGSAATAPLNNNGIGFFAPGSTNPRSINASAYGGAVLTFDNWSGIGGPSNENDPGNRITWSAQAPPEIVISDNSPSGSPPTTINTSSAYTLFSTFAFSLSNTATATDITSIKFTIDGVNNSSDIAGVNVYRDNNANCVYNSGTDSQVGSTFTPVGSPATFTVTFAAGNVQTAGTTPSCVHVLIATSATAQDNNTIGIKIASTDDIVNSQAYPLSATSGPPLSTGTAMINGATVYRWNGGNSTAMGTAGNWTPGTVPNNTRDCQIGSAYSVPIMSGAFACRNTDYLSGGSINWNNSTNIFSVNGALNVGSSFAFQNTTANAVIRMAGTGPQTVNLHGNTFPGNFQVNNTTGPITFEANATLGSLTLNGGVTRVISGVTLTVNGNIAINNGATLDLEPGATVVMGNGTTITVAAGGTLEMIGNTGMTSDIRAVNNSSSFLVNVSGTISAQYYSLKNLGLTGLTINSGANINATYRLQNGSFSYPAVNNAQMLRLLRQVPTNTLDTMTFDSGGSPATGVKSVTTNTSAGTLNMTNYAGSWTGSANSTSVNYIVTWVNETNTLDLSLETTAPASVNQGSVVNMGRFGLEQTDAGSFANTDITSLRLTLIGSGSASDVDYASLYFDSACSGTGGTLVGTQSFSGSPARVEFTGITGATIPFSLTSPPRRCFYVTFSVNSTATNGATIGAQIQSNTHIVNSQSYNFNGAASPPLSLGTSSIVGSTTYWTGATNTNWFTAGNWNGGVPTNALNCIINSASNNPIISSGTAVCKSITIGTGNLTMNGGQLEVYGSFENSGTFTQNTYPLIFRDNGTVATSQGLSIGSGSLNNLQFNKTAGGSVTIDSSLLNVTNTITLPSGSNFTLYVNANKTLSIAGGLTISGGALSVAGGGTVEIGSGQTLTLNGGSLITTGTNDVYPQALSNKAKFTRRGGSGTWNFTATSGTINLTGFLFEWLGTSGLNIGGSTNLTQMNGGQLRSLPNSAGMRALQLNTTGALPSTVNNFGWYWGSGNSAPAEGTSYFLGYSSGCANRTVSFNQWFGDFWPYTNTTTDAKISETNCNIVIDRANSPVSLTEFKATGYDGKVVLEWTTGLEWYHKGFNIFRSISPSTGFTQINHTLIRNDLFSTNMHGTYAFIDEDVANGVTYYYKLEDISTTEERTLHGPVSAQPLLIYGAPPPPLASTIVSNNPTGGHSSGGAGAVEATPGMMELEPQITLLSKTQNSYRLRITIPAHQLANDAHNPSYQRLTIPLYSRTTRVGHPELLERTLMLKVPQATSATFSLISNTSTDSSNIWIAPAPAWTLNAGHYEQQWSLDATAYNTNLPLPAQPISLGSMIQNNGQHYLPIVISPVAYNAQTRDFKKYNELVLDVFLNNDNSWAPQTPIAVGSVWGTEGALRIGITRDGMHQISYDDLMNAGVIAPFDHGDVTRFKLYYMDQEHPLDVSSNSGLFSSGDTLRFFAKNNSSNESTQSYMMLVHDSASPVPGLRMPARDASTLSGEFTSLQGFSRRVHFEENNVAVFNEPYDQDMDLFVWGLFYAVVDGAHNALTTEVELPYLVSTGQVKVQVVAKSRATTADNYSNNLRLYINDQPVGDKSFSGSQTQIVSFDVDALAFGPGKNKLTLRPTGQHLISGEYDMVYIDSFDIYYNQSWNADSDQVLVMNQQPGADIHVDHFTDSHIVVYDLSQFGLTEKWTGAAVQGSDPYSVALPTPVDGQWGRRLWISSEAALLSPASLELNYGSQLRSNTQQADVIYVGHPDLLDAVEPLAAFRRSQGYKTALVTLDSIYNEFGNGVVSTEAIRDFFHYAHSQWNVKPRYFVLLGDGTYDPKGYQNPVMALRFPVKLMKGAAFNYGSDHWYVTTDENPEPFAIVGRIPAATPGALHHYVQKVLSYEKGDARPVNGALTVLTDKAQYNGENFDAFSQELTDHVKTWNPRLAIHNHSRSQLNDVSFKDKIMQSFSQSSVVHYMGHGAENMWADNAVFNNNDIDVLANTRYPIVVAMDCLNASFYDPTAMGMAEKMVMRPQSGAIVFWGSTSMTPPSVQHVYQKAFYERMLQSDTSDIGEAVKLSKSQAYQQAPFAEALQSWTIIGDPMVQAVLPQAPAPTPTPAPVASGGGSRGCSVFGGDQFTQHQSVAWDLMAALLLEVLIALALIKTLVRLSQRNS